MSTTQTLVQLSDCHIDDLPQSMGVNTQTNLKKIIQAATQKNADAFIISGDLSHHGTQQSYQILQQILRPIESDLMVLVGNHDNADNLNQMFAQQLKPTLRLDDWEVIALDSTQLSSPPEKGFKVSGYLSRSNLAQLTATLQTTTAKYNILVLHHPIVSMQSDWDDALSLENPKDLFKLMDKYPKIKAVLWGHAHQAAVFKHNNIQLISCPSTALQFNGDEGIGFNYYQLHNDGKLNFETQWI